MFFFSVYFLDFSSKCSLINGGWYKWYLSIWFTGPWLFPCCKDINFTAYLIGYVFIYFSNIVKLILRIPLRSLWQFLGLFVGPFIYFTNKLCVLDLMVNNILFILLSKTELIFTEKLSGLCLEFIFQLQHCIPDS